MEQVTKKEFNCREKIVDELTAIRADLLLVLELQSNDASTHKIRSLIRQIGLRIDELCSAIAGDDYESYNQARICEDMSDSMYKKNHIEVLEAQCSSLKAEIERLKKEL